jgi:hypothetical protein
MSPGRCPVAHSACEPTAGQDPPHLSSAPGNQNPGLYPRISGASTLARCQWACLNTSLPCRWRVMPLPAPPLPELAAQTPDSRPWNRYGRANKDQQCEQGRANAGSDLMKRSPSTRWIRTALDRPDRRGPSSPSPRPSAENRAHF